MIDGFRIEVTAEELGRHLETRVQYHRERAAECTAKAKRVAQVDELPDEEDADTPMAVCWPGYAHELHRRADRHSHRELFFIFARDHIVANEVYRLSDRDLKMLEWLPVGDLMPMP